MVLKSGLFSVAQEHNAENKIGELSLVVNNLSGLAKDDAAVLQEVTWLMNNLPIGIAVFSADGQACYYVNEEYARLFRISPKDAIGKTPLQINGKEALEIARPFIEEMFGTKAPVSYVQPSGYSEKARWGQVTYIPRLNAKGDIERIIVALRDITFERYADRVVHDSEHRLASFMALSEEGIVIHNEGLIVDINQALCRMVGHREEELIGTPVLDYVASDCRANVAAHISRGSTELYANRLIHRDGAEIAVEQMGRMIQFKGQRMRMTIVRDARERLAAQQRIHFLAHFDELTGLPNRAYFTMQLQDALASREHKQNSAALLFIDLDKFKRINDSLGHGAGDEVLKIVTQRLLLAVKTQDIVARHSGDEFVILLNEADSHAQVREAATQILKTLTAPVSLDSHEVPLSASVGIAIYPEHGATPKELIAHADAAMVAAKQRGSGSLQFYNSAMSEAAYHAIVMEQQLYEAARRNEFVVYYQPQVDSRDGRLVGLEALLRWQHPKRGLLLPGQFLPLAEERQLMRVIGDWVLRDVLSTLQQWRRQALKLVPVSVNLSSQQFEAHDFVPALTQLLQSFEIPSSLLELELTERMLMEDVSLVREQLAGLRKMGVGIAVDDFGTGFSSLAHLKQYAIDRVKIDQSFVRDLPDAADSVAITQAIVQMAHSLGLRVIAEGVESEAQRKFLLNLGCDELQGYLFGKAMPLEKITILLRG